MTALNPDAAISLRGFALPHAGGLAIASLDLERGAFAQLVGGPSSGKSALLETLAGRRRAFEGRAMVLGTDLGALTASARAAMRRRMGLALARPRFVETLSVGDNLALALAWSDTEPAEARKRAAAMLDWSGLDGEAAVARLGRSERARLALARALARAPELLLVDDPADDLAPEDRPRWARLLEAAQHSGAATLLACRADDALTIPGASVLRLRGGLVAAA